MKRDKNKGDKLNTRTFGYIAGAALLLAILTVVLCIMGGVFDFDSEKEEEARVTAPQQTYAVPVTAPEHTAEPTSTPEPTPTPTPETHAWTISAIAGKGGVMSPSGIVEAEEGGNVTFQITPDEGYVLSELKVDGEAVEAEGTYTFRNVEGNHSIYAVFRLAPETPAVTGTPFVTGPPSSATDIR